ncbi:unnamed protein product [Chondrus crispus]|uniref:Uncharacterized protein n=1 Tax=Chondrus crispus TaxID=2769 RepID=R7QNH7_CHOCR|nr:unnamed protein product [Chondrus crispus]CDF39659.1 unnamed protein product [Chondrus crispus]|eukprot:XP_005709953.1 unnamed protein product [Chondrus crispus]
MANLAGTNNTSMTVSSQTIHQQCFFPSLSSPFSQL